MVSTSSSLGPISGSGLMGRFHQRLDGEPGGLAMAQLVISPGVLAGARRVFMGSV